MNFNQACEILGIQKSASEDEAKKAFRAKSKILHPDINKEPDAEVKFKELNEAYQIFQAEEQPEQSFDFNPFSSNPFSTFGQNPFAQHFQQVQTENIFLNTSISFKEAVQGCKKEIKFNRKTKCQSCNGQGHQQINNGCTNCNGRGQVISRQGNMVFSQTCNKCNGKAASQRCQSCNAKGTLDAEISISVSIPPGIQNDNTLRLSNVGNFAGSFGPIDQYTDVHLKVSVTPQEGLSIQGNNVVCNTNISLLDALKGCTKSVPTILGDKEIQIPPSSKNKDEIPIPNLGINNSPQKVIINIDYPNDINSLISFLETQ